MMRTIYLIKMQCTLKILTNNMCFLHIHLEPYGFSYHVQKRALINLIHHHKMFPIMQYLCSILSVSNSFDIFKKKTKQLYKSM